MTVTQVPRQQLQDFFLFLALIPYKWNFKRQITYLVRPGASITVVAPDDVKEAATFDDALKMFTEAELTAPLYDWEVYQSYRTDIRATASAVFEERVVYLVAEAVRIYSPDDFFESFFTGGFIGRKKWD